MKNKNKISIEKTDAKELHEKIKSLVIARIRVLGEDISISIGGEDLQKEQMINHINNNDEIGKNIIDTQIEFLRDMASGALYETR